jgi:xylono-1,5-lactonase
LDDPPRIEQLTTLEGENMANRNNDGKCDERGRFWIGTLHKGSTKHSGWLYRVDRDGQIYRAAGPFICTNGPSFSPDGTLIYCVDSFGKAIYRYTLDKAGDLCDRHMFVQFEDPAWGYPDGLTTDDEGCIWVAHWAGSRVSRFSPCGEFLSLIELPTAQITSCAFGGESLRTLFVTSASWGLNICEEAESLAGAVFAVDLDVGGPAANRFSG